MLARLDTGYEGKFDFPRRTVPPSLTYLVATLPRTGSTWFTHLLWETGCLGAPLEYLNFDPSGPYYFAARSPSVQSDLWHSVLSRRASPNGAFGLKCFPSQLETLRERNPQLLSEILSMFLADSRPPRVIYLERADRTAQAISYARASLSGVWRSEQEGMEGSTVSYSETAVRRAREALDLQRAAWEQMFSDLGIQPLRISYEAILSDSAGTILKVAKFLGVELHSNDRLVVPTVHKQPDKDAKAWRQRLLPEASKTGGGASEID